MELELGLSPSNCTSLKVPCLKELDYCDDNLSSLSCQSSCVNDGDYDQEERNYDNGLYKRKRGFDQVESYGFCVSKTLPLLFWDKQPNEDDDKDTKRLCKSASFTLSKNGGDEIVGWPPIKTIRKKLNDTRQQQHRGRLDNNRTKYVKVQMEGCFITRKIDLKLYSSYHTLASTLLLMFGKGQYSLDAYKLTYQDGEGDWLLVGDVPWRTFIQLVQRLKMVRRDC